MKPNTQSGFDSNAFQILAKQESSNFWFRSRNDIIRWAACKFSPSPQKILEIGCGTGFVTMELKRAFPNAELTATEFHEEGLKYARIRVPDAQFIQLDARHLDSKTYYDLVGAFDVLEHIEEDEVVIRNIHGAMTRNGVLLITVPQHTWLWSNADTLARHARRYTREDLVNKLKLSGFDILTHASFVSLLTPLMFISRRANANSDFSTEIAPPRIINHVLWLILQLEIGLIKMGLRIPFGGSLLVVARKK